MCSNQLMVKNGFSLRDWLSRIYLSFLNQCPKCEYSISKIEGCPHMTCVCRHEFCWTCFHDYYYDNGQLYNSHDDSDCAFITMSKISLIIFSMLAIILNYSSFYTPKWLFSYLIHAPLFILKIVVVDLYLFYHLVSMGLVVRYIFSNENYKRYNKNYW